MKLLRCTLALVIFIFGYANLTMADLVSEIASDSPLAYWRLGETSTAESAIDGSGNGHHGTYTGSGVLLNQTGLTYGANTSAGFSNSDRVEFAGFEKFGTGFSNEFWLKVNSTPGSLYSSLVGDGEGSLDFFLMTYLHNDGGQLRIRPHVKTNVILNPDSAVAINVGQTYHIVSTWDKTSGDLKLFIDGSEVGLIGTANSTGNPVNTNNPIYIGQDNRNAIGVPPVVIDEVAIYDYALDPTRIQAHFVAASVPEPSSQYLLLTLLTALGAGRRYRRRQA